MLPRWLAILALALFALVALLPVAYLAAAAWLGPQPATLEIWQRVLLDPRQRVLLLNSLGLALGTTLGSLLLGVPLALLTERTDFPGRAWLRYAVLLPLMVPPHIQAIAWLDLCSRQGWLNAWLMGLFRLDSPAVSLSGLPGAVLVLTLAYFPFVTLLTASGLAAMDRNLEEAALPYQRPGAVLRHISLPLVRPQVLAGAVFVFVFAVADYGVPDLFQVNTYPVEIFAQFSAFYDEQAAVMLCLPLLAVTIGLMLGQKWLMGGRSYVAIGEAPPGAPLQALGKWKLLAVALVTAVLAAAVVVPLGTLASRAASSEVLASAWRSSAPAILHTLLLAASAATLILLMCFPIAYLLERTRGAAARAFGFLVFVPFAIPGTVFGIGLIRLWNRPQTAFLYGSFLLLLLGYAARFSPFAIQILSASLRRFGREFEEAALLVSGNWFYRMRRIVWPASRAGLAVAWLVAFILCLGELATTLLVVPPGVETLTLRLYGLLHYGAHEMVAALALLLVGLSFVPAVLLIVWARRRRHPA